MNNTGPATPNTSVGLAAFLGDIAAVTKRLPATWVRRELHSINVTDRYVRMEFIEVDRDGAQIAKVQGGCPVAAWRRIEADLDAAGLALAAGSQIIVTLAARLNPVYGFQVDVQDIDLTFALDDLNARLHAIRISLQDAGIWGQNRLLQRPPDFVRMSVIAPPGATGLGDFRSQIAWRLPVSLRGTKNEPGATRKCGHDGKRAGSMPPATLSPDSPLAQSTAHSGMTELVKPARSIT